MGQCFSASRAQDAPQPKHGIKTYLVQQASETAFSDSKNEQTIDSVMATSFSNMNITNPIKGLVSKRRNRYKKDGFNLDLTYITDNIIAMGYPASKIEGVYRNHIDDVVKFLDKKHPDHYYIYNLCSERSYDKMKFHNRVKIFPFDDHNPPKIDSIQPFCNDVHEWLSIDKKNVAVVHCKAGKGRTGTMICCYLLHSRMFSNAESALNYYGQTRTQDKKGVTIPSQVRYVQYYETLLKQHLFYTPVSMYIKEFILNPVPNFTGGQGSLSLTISHQTLLKEGDKYTPKLQKLRKNDWYEVKKSGSPFSIKLDYCLPLKGDIKVEFFSKTMMRKEKLFQFWFNTFFICNSLNGFLPRNGSSEEVCYVVDFEKNELDIVNKKDKQNKMFHADFKLTLHLQRIPRDDCCPTSYERHSQTQDTPSESSAESSDDYTNEDEDWDSGEGNSLIPKNEPCDSTKS
ncbi:phosphatidylinositol 3,4,5-trisphosphate 3-phosphatase and dual-specificity protein phosphatase PTEN isoform X1 [Diabrotica virgifera virgifera]|uniref:Phosphatidylinositol 3,4,5-trisphosphate 3-phosphatase and dual-specificity protein phosphatase PTEN n=2 Tax=Diabrotica virgifera virgifera TaxID=50390 RepID=A0A6P7G0E9_DIAVI|nr:phosphatidylinositol 3,4,5-trisphosphate 3-phosphatase and dual-specificity protein phosphatase PTEN isoform X1 [Diabrotica virgifera virgifera]